MSGHPSDTSRQLKQFLGVSLPNEIRRKFVKHLFIVPDNDLEAKTIQDILKNKNIDFLITLQGWGANFENLEIEIKNATEDVSYDVVYFVEITGVPENPRFVSIDHHRESAFELDSSLEQVSMLVGHTLTEIENMISHNDKAYFEGMLEYQLRNHIDFHTAKKKCMEIRALDWDAQGITSLQIQQALTAVKDRRYENGKCIISCEHSKTAPIMDSMFWEDVEYIILSEDGEVNIDAATSTIMKLKEVFSNCWFGGRLSYGKGYWGTASYQQEEVLNYFLTI